MFGFIYFFDQDFSFLIFLLKKEEYNLKFVSVLFVDENYYLYVGFENGRINVYNVYKYLEDVQVIYRFE